MDEKYQELLDKVNKLEADNNAKTEQISVLVESDKEWKNKYETLETKHNDFYTKFVNSTAEVKPTSDNTPKMSREERKAHLKQIITKGGK